MTGGPPNYTLVLKDTVGPVPPGSAAPDLGAMLRALLGDKWETILGTGYVSLPMLNTEIDALSQRLSTGRPIKNLVGLENRVIKFRRHVAALASLRLHNLEVRYFPLPTKQPLVAQLLALCLFRTLLLRRFLLRSVSHAFCNCSLRSERGIRSGDPLFTLGTKLSEREPVHGDVSRTAEKPRSCLASRAP
jgi:hypothetical protein